MLFPGKASLQSAAVRQCQQLFLRHLWYTSIKNSSDGPGEVNDPTL